MHKEDSSCNNQDTRTRCAICLGTSGNLQDGFKFLALNSAKIIVWRNWDALPMPDTVIAHIITLGGEQPRQLTVTDWHGRLIIDVQIPEVPPATPTTLEPDNVNIEIPGVAIEENFELPGVDRNDNETPKSVEINDDLDIPAQDQPPIELEPATEAAIEIKPFVTPASIEATALQRYTVIRSQRKQDYAPSMTGKRYGYESTQLDTYWTTKYDFAMMQISDQGMLHTDAHMFALP